MADILTTYTEAIKELYGARLRSVVLYGSRASGEETGESSDYNVLIILDKVDFADLKVLQPFTAKWIKKGNPPPLLFSEQGFVNAADVFPVEYTDMKEKHKVLAGNDPFAGLTIDLKHLRHQCEYELRSKLLKLRQGYLLSQGKPREVRSLLVGSLSSLLVLFRHAITLLGKQPPLKNTDALRVLGECAGMDPQPFLSALALKQGASVPSGVHETLMNEVMHEIETVIRKIDSVSPS